MILQPTITLNIELTARYCRDKNNTRCEYKYRNLYCDLFKKRLEHGKTGETIRLKECKKSESLNKKGE